MARKTGLGRGLGALIQAAESSTPVGGITYLNIDEISPNPRQPRKNMHPGSLSELAVSIREHGILQPLVVSMDLQTGAYLLVAGERRLRAAKQAGLQNVPVILRDVDDLQRLELALVENLQRADLNPLEAAEAYQQLAEEFNLSHDEISNRVGKSRTAITNTLRLLKLSDVVKIALSNEQITEGHARALLGLSTPTQQNHVLQIILQRNLNVRQTEDMVRTISEGITQNKSTTTKSPEMVDIEDKLRQHLGTRVSLKNRQDGSGSITIQYYSNEELDTLIRNILGESG